MRVSCDDIWNSIGEIWEFTVMKYKTLDVRYKRHQWWDMKLQWRVMRDFRGEIFETPVIRYERLQGWDISEIWGTPVVRYERHHWQDMRFQGWYMRDFSGEIWETLEVRYEIDEILEGSSRDIWESSDEVWEVQWWDMRNSNDEAREIHLCDIRDSCGKMWKTSLMRYETTLVLRFKRQHSYKFSCYRPIGEMWKSYGWLVCYSWKWIGELRTVCQLVGLVQSML